MADIKQQVGDMIRKARKGRSLTQKELGKLVGVTESMMSKYESGEQNPGIETLARIAQALNAELKVDILLL